MTGPVPVEPVVAPAPIGALWFMRVLVAFARREARTAAGYRVAFLFRGLAFGLSVLTLAFLSKMVGAADNPHLAIYGGDYLAFALVGLVVMDFQQVGVSNLSQRIRTAQILGLIEAEISAPVPAWIVLGVGPVYEFVLATVRAALYFLFAIVAFGVGFPQASLASVILAAPLVMGAFVGLGLLSAATTMLVRRNNPVAVLLGSASLLLSGVVYPVSVLPTALRLLGRMLPLTHALEVMRGSLLAGLRPSQLTEQMTALALFAGVLVPAGVGLFVFALRRARIDGSLTHY